MFAPAKIPGASPGARSNIARTPNISAADASGTSSATATKARASRRSPLKNCGPTFMPTANMKRLNISVLAKSGTAKVTFRRLAQTLRPSPSRSVAAVAPRLKVPNLTRPSA